MLVYKNVKITYYNDDWNKTVSLRKYFLQPPNRFGIWKGRHTQKKCFYASNEVEADTSTLGLLAYLLIHRLTDLSA